MRIKPRIKSAVCYAGCGDRIMDELYLHCQNLWSAWTDPVDDYVRRRIVTRLTDILQCKAERRLIDGYWITCDETNHSRDDLDKGICRVQAQYKPGVGRRIIFSQWSNMPKDSPQLRSFP